MRVGVQQPARAGPENRNRASSRPARSRCSGVPPAMIRDSGMPSTHSLTSTCSLPCDDPRDEDVGVAVVRRGERRLALGLQLVVELLGDPRLELGDQRLDLEARAPACRPAGSSGRSG